ncbi:cytochrome c oxidase subunit I [Polymorphobacter glacialis]|uniref:cytochrome-c oxidase n=1 Tax=Sandarakinorhabdus glacialis TaxID=1614636 RepID=A0A917A3J7_9SPHN|nr:cytochrome c oxidase subunit I [Polymorphobacter glacialis]
MSAEDALAETRRVGAEQLRAVWKRPGGWRRLSSVNNSDVGRWFAFACLVFMLTAGVMALLLRVELATPAQDVLSARQYNQLYSLHGSVMMFLVAVPIFEAISMLLLPAILGARELPFPRLGAMSFWGFALGGLFVIGSIFFDAAPDAGWFMYPPLSTQVSGVGSDVWLLGLGFIEITSIAAAVELITSVLKVRPPGMRLNFIPLYAWYVLVVGAMVIFAFPPLIAGSLLFELERELDMPFFDPTRGGDPVLWQHLFWIFGHPEVYIIFLPAIAITAMIVPTVAQRPIIGYSWIVLSAVGTGFLSFGLWVHHMYTTGLPNISLGFFSAASQAVVIPTGVQIFAFIATLLAGRVTRSTPMLFIAGAFAIFVAGGLTGVMVGLAPFDWQAHDTYFVVAHLHYTLFGGAVLPIIAGIYYFYPLITGHMLSDTLGRWSFWLIFIGFNVTFLPMHLTGLIGMPRRVNAYPAEIGWQALNLVSTIGAFVIAAGFAVFVWDLFRSKRDQPERPRNPWNAGTLEWAVSVPEESWGVRSVPEISSRYPLWDEPEIVGRMDRGEFFLPDAPTGHRETLITSVLDATPSHVLRVSGDSFVPILAAFGLGGSFILPVFKLYWFALASGLVGIAAIVWWHWTTTAQPPEKNARDAGMGLTLPVYVSGPSSTGWWATWITMLALLTAFVSLVFAYFYYWTIWPVFPETTPAAAPHWGGLALLGVAWGLTITGLKLNQRGHAASFRAAFVTAFGCALAGGALFQWAPFAAGMDPTVHAYPAIVFVLHFWITIHAALGALMLGYCVAKSWDGRLTRDYDADVWNTLLVWHFTLGMAFVAAAVTGLYPGAT